MLQCLSFLSGLPSRDSTNGQMEMAGYYVALEGVSKFAIQTAAKAIMRGSLGHTFYPKPPELRLLCEEVMRPIREAEARDRREAEIIREQQNDQRQRERSQASWTPESRARATAKWEATKAQQRLDNAAEETRRDQYDTSPDACMARLKAAAEANGADFNLDKIKNAPGDTFKQAGRAA